MTEIPEHLRKRADEARRKAGLRGDPTTARPVGNLFEAPSSQPPKANISDGLDWTRFGSRPLDIARQVLEVINKSVDGMTVDRKAQKSRDTTLYSEQFDLSETANRLIGDGLYLRIGHVTSLEVRKSTVGRASDGIINFGKDLVLGESRLDDFVSEEITPKEFGETAGSGDITRAYFAPWAELVVDRNGPDSHGLDMLTSFSIRVANNPVDESDDSLLVRRWGSSAQVAYPTIATEGIQHEGRYTLSPYDYLNPGVDPFKIGKVWQFRMQGGVDWVRADEERRPGVADVVETAMSGLTICIEMMRDPQIGERADDYNNQLQAALLPVSSK